MFPLHNLTFSILQNPIQKLGDAIYLQVNILNAWKRIIPFHLCLLLILDPTPNPTSNSTIKFKPWELFYPPNQKDIKFL
mgnify:CR=1 FL=1